MNTVKVRNLELGNGIPAICIPNVGKTKEDILSLTRTYLGMHMDLMEWRMDWYEDVEDIAKVSELVKELRDVMGDTPLLCTFRTDKEGGVHPMSTEKYAELNKAVAATGNADIIDVEIFTGDDIVREMIDAIHASGAKVIASNHDFDKTPAKSDLIYRLRKMQDMGADIPKMAVMPQTKKDVLTLLSATEEMASDYADRPIIDVHGGAWKYQPYCLRGIWFLSDIWFRSTGFCTWTDRSRKITSGTSDCARCIVKNEKRERAHGYSHRPSFYVYYIYFNILSCHTT